MICRRLIYLGMVLLEIWLCPEAFSEEAWSVRPRPSREKRLAPELDLLRHCDSHYMGVCRNGKAVFKVPSNRTKAVQSMSVTMDNDQTPVHSKGHRLLISYADQGRKPFDSTLRAAGLRKIEDYERGSFLLVEPEETITSKTVDALMEDDAVTHAAPDYIMSVSPMAMPAATAPASVPAISNDPLLSQLWGMQNIGATKVWPGFREASNVIVAVIDTGVDFNHPDLRSNMWSKNGRYGYDFFDDDPDPMDEQNHGTHCAGTIAAVGNNGIGVVGVNWRARIMAMRFLGPDGSGSTSDAVKCIDWAVANGAHVLSNSWAGPDTPPELAEAVTRAEQKGVLFVTAAGNSQVGNNNDRVPYYPASLPNSNIIAVAAIDSNNNRGSFSHYGSRSVDIGAPGVGIVSTIRNGQYDKYDGTSMAAPHVAGAAVLVWAKMFPSPAQDRTQMATVRDLIYANARPLPAFAAYWGNSAPARVPGGALDISFLNALPSDGSQSPVRRRLVETRMKVDPEKLRLVGYE